MAHQTLVEFWPHSLVSPLVSVLHHVLIPFHLFHILVNMFILSESGFSQTFSAFQFFPGNFYSLFFSDIPSTYLLHLTITTISPYFITLQYYQLFITLIFLICHCPVSWVGSKILFSQFVNTFSVFVGRAHISTVYNKTGELLFYNISFL